MRFRHIPRGGRYVRVADPDWRQPLDGSYAAERGARWNPPGSFPVVYVCSTVAVARANVLRRFDGLPYSVLDLLPDRRPVLVETQIRDHRAVDIVTDAGARAAGLPTSYPRDADGTEVGWDRCQPVGEAAWDQGETSVACRSAAAPLEEGEELAWFGRGRQDRLRVRRRRRFDEWFT